MHDERNKALAAAMGQLEKEYGKGVFMRLVGDAIEKHPAVSSGSLALDVALGIGGLPKSRVIEVFGEESSGKTTLALHAIAETQKTGGRAAFIDAEHALDPGYAAKLGVKLDELVFAQPDTGEQALEIADRLTRSGAIDLVVVDSVAALTPKAELEGTMDDSQVGLQARMMGKSLRRITGALQRTNTTLIFINQIRQLIGVKYGQSFTTSGGNALKFYASVRIDIRGGKKIMDGEEQIGRVARIKVVKNKLAPPFRTAITQVIFGRGICRFSELIEMGVENDIVTKSGAWYSYGDKRLGQGVNNARSFLEENPELADEIERQLRSTLLPDPAADDRPADPDLVEQAREVAMA